MEPGIEVRALKDTQQQYSRGEDDSTFTFHGQVLSVEIDYWR